MRALTQHLDSLKGHLHQRRIPVLITLIIIAIAAGIWLGLDRIPRKPPSIFDTAVDDVFSYLAEEDFSKLSIEERMKFLADLMQRFKSFSQADSAVASAFFAGLTGPTSERMMNNARVLGKDVLVEGAQQFLTLTDEKDRDAFIDAWLIKWVRFADGATGEVKGMSDKEILDRFTRQGRRDLERGIEIDADMAQQVVDFWERDIGSVASPREQSQIYQFLPAIRQRLVTRSTK
jgi:hypothetical protein